MHQHQILFLPDHASYQQFVEKFVRIMHCPGPRQRAERMQAMVNLAVILYPETATGRGQG